MRNIRIFLIVLLVVVMSGCSVFMPYKEDYICKVPEGKGYCGSLSDGYEYSIHYY